MKQNDKITILYVDDEMINLELFQMTFQNTFEVLTAESGKAGLEIMSKYNKIQVVISDMKMPEKNGIEFISQAKEIYPDVSYLILTGFDINKEIKEALNSGLIKGYFQKPLNRSDITNAVIKSAKHS